MKILITGAGGFLGARLVYSLLSRGERDVRCQVREGRGVDKLRRIGEEFGVALEIVPCNLLSATDTEQLVQGVDLIIHAAAGTRGAPADMMLNTLVTTRNLLESMGRAGVRRLALVSSFAVYDSHSPAWGAVFDEHTPLEALGPRKGPYALSKIKQEHLVSDYQRRLGFDLVFVRPGVIYGPGAGAFSTRVGIRALGFFFGLGNGCQLPLTYVDNCADSVVSAALDGIPGAAYNAVDDDLPSCRQFLRQYCREVERLRVVPVPYLLTLLGSRLLVRYSRWSKGQLPAVLTPYIVRSMYRPLKYSNAALKGIGWRQRVPTADGLKQHMAALMAALGR